MRVTVRKWGNSLALCIPKALAAHIRLASGSEVEIAIEDDRLVITPAPPGPSLDELLSAVTAENTHGEIGTGGRVGHAAW